MGAEDSIMSTPRELRCYQYVTLPYGRVRDALRTDAAGLFARSSSSAASRAEELGAMLQVGIGALQIGTEVRIEIGSVTEDVSALGDRTARLQIGWTAAKGAGLFPSMEATLSLYPLSATETQLDLEGHYRPPLGVLGNAVDALVGYRIAQASVLRFLEEVAARLTADPPAHRHDG
jgi:hypothetical protein